MTTSVMLAATRHPRHPAAGAVAWPGATGIGRTRTGRCACRDNGDRRRRRRVPGEWTVLAMKPAAQHGDLAG